MCMKQTQTCYQNRIRERRKARGLTQTQLARLLRSNQDVISRYESGRTLPSLATFAKLAAALNTPALLPYFYPKLDKTSRSQMYEHRRVLDIELEYPV